MGQRMVDNVGDIKEKQTLLLANEVLALFQTVNKVPSIPFRPKGGDIYVFKPNSLLKKDDWKADGHRWNNACSKFLPRKDPLFKKAYFYTKGEHQKSVKEFRKEVYFPVDNMEHIVLVHYIGDEKLSIQTTHGNSMKQTKLFFQRKPSVMQKIVEEVENVSEKAPHKIYKQMVANEAENQATGIPRNIQQVQNIKAAMTGRARLSKDSIMNLHELAW